MPCPATGLRKCVAVRSATSEAVQGQRAWEDCCWWVVNGWKFGECLAKFETGRRLAVAISVLGGTIP